MFHKILLCTDLSPASKLLLSCANEMKAVGAQEVVLAHAVHATNPLSDPEKVAERAWQLLSGQKESLEEMNFSVSAVMPKGFPSQTLLEVAKEHDVSAVVLGSHGKGILHAKTLGSVSSSLIHEAKHPILLLRTELMAQGETDSVCRGMFSHVLFPTDFSDIAELALFYLGKMASETKSAITLVHVVGKKPHDPRDAERQEEAAQYLMESKKRRLESMGAFEVAIDLRHGEPSEEIIASLEKSKSTMILMGTHGKGLIQEVLLGSVAHDIARLATVPIMYIPAGACCP